MRNFVSAVRLIAVVVLCTIVLSAIVLPVGEVYGAEREVVFSRTPSGYDSKSGSFKLWNELFRYISPNYQQIVCLSYDYFVFDAQRGQLLSGQLRSGQAIFYLVLNASSLYGFENSNCGLGYLSGSEQGTALTVNWTAPADGQYDFVVLTNGFYEGPVYFTQ